jgi:hypothetical protein
MRYALFTTALFFASLFITASLSAQTADQFAEGDANSTPIQGEFEPTISGKTLKDLDLGKVIGTTTVQVKTDTNTMVLQPCISGIVKVDPQTSTSTYLQFSNVIITSGTPGVILKEGVKRNGDGTIISFRVGFWAGKDYLYITYVEGPDGKFIPALQAGKLRLGKYDYTITRGSGTTIVIPMMQKTADPVVVKGRTN